MAETEQGPGRDKDIKSPRFFKSRLFLIAAGTLLFLAVVGGIYSFVLLRDDAAQEQKEISDPAEETANGPGESETAEILPQQRRTEDQAEDRAWSFFDPAVDPFADPMRLTGLATGGRGGNMAIIVAGGTSYIVSEGDYVADLWAVLQIDTGRVVLRAHNQEISLFLDQPPLTRTLELAPDDDFPEEGT